MPTDRFCARCAKLLERPIIHRDRKAKETSYKADYVLASDFIVDEPRDVFYALILF